MPTRAVFILFILTLVCDQGFAFGKKPELPVAAGNLPGMTEEIYQEAAPADTAPRPAPPEILTEGTTAQAVTDGIAAQAALSAETTAQVEPVVLMEDTTGQREPVVLTGETTAQAGPGVPIEESTAQIEAPVPAPAKKELSKKEKPKVAPAGPVVRTHRVAAGDTLPILADRYYGDRDGWVKIYEANKDRVEKGSLRKGQVILIP